MDTRHISTAHFRKKRPFQSVQGRSGHKAWDLLGYRVKQDKNSVIWVLHIPTQNLTYFLT